jgi:hypothetical protein
MKKLYLILGAAAVVIVLTAAGCLITGTFVITATLVPNESNPDHVDISNLTYTNGELEADLNGDSDFEDNKDKIRNIDAVGFYAEVTNLRSEPVSFYLFIEEDTSANWSSSANVIDSATAVVFTGFTLAANQSRIVTWDESLAYVSVDQRVKDIVETGSFSLYPAATPSDLFSIRVDSLVVIVTLTGG